MHILQHECVIVFLFVFPAAALALCKYSMAEWNATSQSANGSTSACPHHGDGDNCTGRGGQVVPPAVSLMAAWKAKGGGVMEESADVNVNMRAKPECWKEGMR